MLLLSDVLNYLIESAPKINSISDIASYKSGNSIKIPCTGNGDCILFVNFLVPSSLATSTTTCTIECSTGSYTQNVSQPIIASNNNYINQTIFMRNLSDSDMITLTITSPSTLNFTKITDSTIKIDMMYI